MKCVQEHCSICGRDMAMPVVQEDEKHPGLIWVRCPVCREIKPVEISSSAWCETADVGDGPAPPSGEPARGAAEHEPRRTVRHYRAGERFQPGEWIYHPAWDDTGQVVEKLSSTGGREIIVVSFVKSGRKRLVNNFAD
ncbi:MAG TPA: hypothetical protein VM658_12255 [bacterium]|nr:hypothetical protein [bacterium]